MLERDADYTRYPILYVDDEAAALATFENNFRKEFRVTTVQTGSEALRLLGEEAFAVLIADQRMPEVHGVEVIEQARTIRPNVVPIILTGYTDSESLKQAINRAGVFHYIDKPWKRQYLGQVIRRALDHYHLTAENLRLSDELRRANEQLQLRNEALASENAYLRRETAAGHQLVGESRAIQQLREQIARVAPHRATALLLGPTGVGKEVVARAIHAASPRCERPLITLNCSAIPRDLVETELFGHEKGAFTSATAARPGRFVMADGGTLFLDEVGDLPFDLQPKLLRVLQEGEVEPVGSGRAPRKVDVRVLAATNRNLAQAVRDGTFREDLFHRLNVVPIRLPALRDRREDIPVLARHFLEVESNALHGRPAPQVSEATLETLARAEYPGNVRDLRNLIIRVLINFPDEHTLGDAHFLECLDQPAPRERAGARSFRDLRDEAERRIFEEALARCGGNKRKTAQALELTEQGLHKALRRLGMAGSDEPENG